MGDPTRTDQEDPGMAPARCGRCGCSCNVRDIIPVCRGCVSRWDQETRGLLRDLDHTRAALRSADDELEPLRERLALKELQAEAIAAKLDQVLTGQHQQVAALMDQLREAEARATKAEEELATWTGSHQGQAVAKLRTELDRHREAVSLPDKAAQRDLVERTGQLRDARARVNSLEAEVATLKGQAPEGGDTMVIHVQEMDRLQDKLRAYKVHVEEMEGRLAATESKLRQAEATRDRHHQDRMALQRDRDGHGEEAGRLRVELGRVQEEEEEARDNLAAIGRELGLEDPKDMEAIHRAIHQLQEEAESGAAQLHRTREAIVDKLSVDSPAHVVLRDGALLEEVVAAVVKDLEVVRSREATVHTRRTEAEVDRGLILEQLNAIGRELSVSEPITPKGIVSNIHQLQGEVDALVADLRRVRADRDSQQDQAQVAVHALTRLALSGYLHEEVLEDCGCEDCQEALAKLRELGYLRAVAETEEAIEDPELVDRIEGHLSRRPKVKDLRAGGAIPSPVVPPGWKAKCFNADVRVPVEDLDGVRRTGGLDHGGRESIGRMTGPDRGELERTRTCSCDGDTVCDLCRSQGHPIPRREADDEGTE